MLRHDAWPESSCLSQSCMLTLRIFSNGLNPLSLRMRSQKTAFRETSRYGKKLLNPRVKYSKQSSVLCSSSCTTEQNGRACLKTTNNLPDTRHEVIAESTDGEEDKAYPLHVKIPQVTRTDPEIRTHEVEDAIKCLAFTTLWMPQKVTILGK